MRINYGQQSHINVHNLPKFPLQISTANKKKYHYKVCGEWSLTFARYVKRILEIMFAFFALYGKERRMWVK